tara:strand:- start:268 stop:822 length:555 start_codon:yes stop_codon:yes gene_type:complete
MDNFNFKEYLYKNPLLNEQEETGDKDPVDTVEKIPDAGIKKVNAQVTTPKTFANAVLDFIKVLQQNEKIDFTKNTSIKSAINYLQKIQESKKINEQKFIKSNKIKKKLKDLIDEIVDDNILMNREDVIHTFKVHIEKFQEEEDKLQGKIEKGIEQGTDPEKLASITGANLKDILKQIEDAKDED